MRDKAVSPAKPTSELSDMKTSSKGLKSKLIIPM
jgi:hypothetical protein